MKKFILLVIIILGNTSFKEKSYILTDFRDAFIGNYSCKIICSESNFQTKKIDYISYNSSIAISKDIQDSVLDIYVENVILKIKLDGKYIQAYPKGGHYGGNFFSSDSIDFRNVQSRAHSCRYLGKKQ